MQRKPWNSRRFIRAGDRYEFLLDGSAVSAIRLSRDVRFYLDDDFYTQIELWMPFTFEKYGQCHHLDPFETSTLAPLLALVRKSLRKVVCDSGFLSLDFDDGTKIHAPVDQSEHRWEAWEITDKCGFHVVCTLGGKIVVVQPSAEIARRRTRSDDP
ncbi:MAG: DUF6188 family protein [Chloroflexi bacterium]|nr:DUF6188 family protein [Chloroflexota bacterium]